jgi:hypothetical protein
MVKFYPASRLLNRRRRRADDHRRVLTSPDTLTHTPARRRAAVVGSFVVYLVPLVGPHAFWVVGEALAMDVASDRATAWIASDFAVAFAAQLLVWLVLRWSLGAAVLRKLSWLAIIPLTIGLHLALLVAGPSYFLIEPDTVAETTNWDEHCLVRGVSLAPIASGANQAADGRQISWVQRSDGGYALLRVSDCAILETTLPKPTLLPGGRVNFMIAPVFASPGGAAIIERTEPASGTRTWSLFTAPAAPLQPVNVPDGVELPPILSRQQDAVGWVQRVAGTGPPVMERILVRPTSDSTVPDVDIDLRPFGAASYALIDLDTSTRQVTLWRTDQPLVVDFDGRQVPSGFDVGIVSPQATTYLGAGDGWVVWDAYLDDGPYGLAWLIGARSGRRQTNAGRSVTAAAVDPAGRYVAVSETTTLSIGNARDVVYVLRTDTGADVFRKYLPRYARSQVVFYTGNLFGYSDLDGTHILRIPAGL